jgi:hypothetical protein
MGAGHYETSNFYQLLGRNVGKAKSRLVFFD